MKEVRYRSVLLNWADCFVFKVGFILFGQCIQSQGDDKFGRFQKIECEKFGFCRFRENTEIR